MAWLLWLIFPPLAVFVLPDNCVRNKVMAFAVSFLLLIFLFPLSWLYVAGEILHCQSVEAHQPAQAYAAQPAQPTAQPATVTQPPSGSPNNIVVVVKG